jgi:hypothetical protein
LDIKPTTILKGYGLCKLTTKKHDQVDEVDWENETSLYANDILFALANMD